MPEALKTVEQAFQLYGQNLVQMPAKIYLHLGQYAGDFRAMPAYLGKINACGIKWVSVYPGNKDAGLPAVMATIILSDSHTGYPFAIMDGTYITSLRTGAAGGIAAKYLARKDAAVVGLVGCGAQARSQVLALNELFQIKQVFVWGKRRDEADRFKKTLKPSGLNIDIKEGIRECVRDADIVVTTTPARRPLVNTGWIKPGTHINAIGADAPGKEELDPHLLKQAKIIVDDWEQARHSGEINVALAKGFIRRKDIHATLGEVICGKKPGRANSQEITIFDSTGLAIQDVAIADLAYKKAIQRKIGKWINIC